MAGMFTRLNGYVYDGTHIAAEVLENGQFVEIGEDGVEKIAAAGDAVMRVEEHTEFYGRPALRLEVISEGTKEIYMVENVVDPAEGESFDSAEYQIKAGEYVRMKRPLAGEQILITVSDEQLSALAVGSTVSPANGGGLAKNESETD